MLYTGFINNANHGYPEVGPVESLVDAYIAANELLEMHYRFGGEIILHPGLEEDARCVILQVLDEAGV